ncbi:MAG: hypothetical protein HY298_08140 [Verrucomicrobia bacterium]|nr:hypothetical protein [Verrucomicrobiota bacterium]
MQIPTFEEVLEKIVAHDPRYHRDAYNFLREALAYTQKKSGKVTKDKIQHVTGQALLAGIREFALTEFGPMALTVFEEWGVRTCEDFGEIVFNMVESGLLAKTETDSRDDFKGGYDFKEAFHLPFLPTEKKVAPKLDSRPARISDSKPTQA